MVAHHHDLFLRIIEQLRAALALIFEGQTAVFAVNHDTIEKHCGILVDGRQGAVGQTGQYGRVDRMDVHGAAGVGAMAVKPSVQAPSGGVRRVGTFQSLGIIGVDQEKVRGFDPAEMHLIWVHQELGAIVIHRQAEVVGHGLVHVQARRPAEGGRHIHTLLPMVHIGANLGN